MVERFEDLTIGVTQIYKCIRKIKRHRTEDLGIRGTYVMSLYYLSFEPGGLTAAELCARCHADKAGISRILADMESEGYIKYDSPDRGKRYRAKAILTRSGRGYADRLIELIGEAVEKGGAGISEDERRVFFSVLFKISDNLTEMCRELESK